MLVPGQWRMVGSDENRRSGIPHRVENGRKYVKHDPQMPVLSRFIAAKSRKASVANVKSMLWNGECAILGYAGRAASSLDGCGSNHIIRRQRSPDPLQLKLTDRLNLHDILDLHQHSRTDEDLTRFGLIAEPRGDV